MWLPSVKIPTEQGAFLSTFLCTILMEGVEAPKFTLVAHCLRKGREAQCVLPYMIWRYWSYFQSHWLTADLTTMDKARALGSLRIMVLWKGPSKRRITLAMMRMREKHQSLILFSAKSRPLLSSVVPQTSPCLSPRFFWESELNLLRLATPKWLWSLQIAECYEEGGREREIVAICWVRDMDGTPTNCCHLLMPSAVQKGAAMSFQNLVISRAWMNIEGTRTCDSLMLLAKEGENVQPHDNAPAYWIQWLFSKTCASVR